MMIEDYHKNINFHFVNSLMMRQMMIYNPMLNQYNPINQYNLNFLLNHLQLINLKIKLFNLFQREIFGFYFNP
jgi:hypothetical protein